ncbi:hypothetical protein MP619_06645 [Streptococcus dysgalactiae]|uniref:Uncharacterized protein n=1 Tax=Streptococcus dysgalactiae TaxID=1334 RepID=A0AAE9UKC4_STRDY|nr:hypothetical protein [Streptococcus dysgalactiae]WAI92199.1 hypothetical protein MP619_06645 [Streptococcus dysgalactiae]WHL22674.1 hypothetical protein QLH62_06540 [Streptococcus iniae]
MTFNIIDVNSHETRAVNSRDELLTQLEIADKRCEALGLTASYLIEHLDRDGESVLENIKFTLPYDGVIDELLGDFGFKRPSKSSPLNAFKDKNKGKPMNTTPEIVSQNTPASSPALTAKMKRQARQNKLMLALVGLLALGGLSLASLSLGQIASLKQANHTLTEQVEQLETLTVEQDRIDVFSRYFLSNYYANNKETVSDFIVKDLKKTIQVSEGTLQSVILEEVTQNKDTYTVTYVLVVKDNEENRSNVRLSFEVKEDTKSAYGYLVTTQPKSSKYPK